MACYVLINIEKEGNLFKVSTSVFLFICLFSLMFSLLRWCSCERQNIFLKFLTAVSLENNRIFSTIFENGGKHFFDVFRKQWGKIRNFPLFINLFFWKNSRKKFFVFLAFTSAPSYMLYRAANKTAAWDEDRPLFESHTWPFRHYVLLASTEAWGR